MGSDRRGYRLKFRVCAFFTCFLLLFMSDLSAPKIGLALHTSTPELGLAWLDAATTERRSQVWTLGQALSSELHLYLKDFIQPYRWQDLAFLAVAQGPGGFTGTRIGVVTARTLAQQLDLPLYGVSTLAAIAFRLAKQELGQMVAISLPARRGELFGAIYRVQATGLETVLADQLFTPDTWAIALAKFAGVKVLAAPDSLGVTVEEILELAYLQWQVNPVSPWGAVVPFYGQHPVHK